MYDGFLYVLTNIKSLYDDEFSTPVETWDVWMDNNGNYVWEGGKSILYNM